ncbi:hypothetical protein A3D01_04975 [Candidatus Woesebacteria bacterium RIFCSPHIGHO2_02_FULL_39_13]|uniref:Glycosyltransferase 2-like domain-containing protein n=1 Tax=Candidatus Woesebacteria bacterium RIFCSPHIGHO2_02_FULL_39_13 TaxID=1802505 RepID=A0A1F7YZX6_9BACT|nr:MAG: hypothetical protein A2692_00295 [Candidatus Woesebacteria bacterium RIFCSPHIGHO2_01_FULL_39_95]OGM32916.1 MAG: hypothetical protein A3D01_04975 [Candidatus Woesebacteria bacterium RIFCSPHIGHO2_02_FULL_39_13]OGM74429.1 MAG: hypothetical protein A3H19_05285 [Candidatus Woesebacteria bacterium RIFCSPLOWO2_12_FULL_39_9]
MVSVIITTKNEEDVLERLLVSIQDNIYKNTEAIVVDNNSSDKTKIIAKKYTDKVFDFGPERSSQRNFGAKKSNGKYLLILDADMKLSKDVIYECVVLAEGNRKIGEIVIPEESMATNFWEKVKAFERSFYNLEGDRDVDAARFFKREAFLKAGGYDEAITGPEDWDLPDTIGKLGYKIGRIKSKIYHYERFTSPFKVAKKKFYYGLKSHRYLKKQKIPTISPKTVYFLRPVFYKNWKKLVLHPFLSIGMFLMLTLELVYGGTGFFLGKILNK